MTLSHDLLGEAHCVLRPLIPPCSICRLWGPVRDHSAYNRSGTSPVPWGPPWLCFSEMRWIGQLKRLSSGWPAAIKSSPTGYRDAAEGRLYPALIQQFIVIFSPFAVIHSLVPKSVIHCKMFVPSLPPYFAFEKMFLSPSKINGAFIHFCDVLSLSLVGEMPI